jgi:SAM-dependent methyltransferase
MPAGGSGAPPPSRPSPSELLAALYDWEHDDFQDDVALYATLARRTGGPALELACGSGRVLAGLVDAGVDVVGVDRDPAMLARARARLGPAAPRAALVEADLRDELPAGPFGLVVLALDGLGLIPDSQQQLTLLQRVWGALARRGVLVLDLVHVPSLWGEPESTPILQRVGPAAELAAQVTKWAVREFRPAREEMALISVYDLVDEAGALRRYTAELTIRYFSRHEVELLLWLAGLTLEGIFGDYALGPLTDDSERMVFVAGRGRRPAGYRIQSRPK